MEVQKEKAGQAPARGCTPRLLLLVAVLHIVWHAGIAVAEDAHLFVTGTVMEIDRCASAWLITRHVDPEAHFAFLDEDALMQSQAQQFDTPFAQWRRTHRFSTFESIRNHFRIQDDKVDTIAAIIHQIEINFWNKNAKRQESLFEKRLRQRIAQAPDNNAALDACFSFLDQMNPDQNGEI